MDITNIPAPRVPIIDERNGLMAREWYLFFVNLFNLVGAGTNSVSLSDVQVGPVVNDLSGEIIAIEQASQLAAIARYEQLIEQLNLDPVSIPQIEHEDLTPSAIPQNTIAERSNRVLAWLSTQ